MTLAPASMSSLPVLQGGSLSEPFDNAVLPPLAKLLPEFLRSRRWFRSKARTIARVEIDDVVPFSSVESWLLILRIVYQDGESDLYLLPLSLARASQRDPVSSPEFEPLATLQAEGQQATLYSALANQEFRNAILNAIAENKTFVGRSGHFLAHRLQLPHGVEANLDQHLESFVSRAEQSNTSIIFGKELILKLFRKVESGVNPDIEIGAFLTEHAFQNTPAVLATLEYKDGEGAAYAAGILQKFVPNQGDAWAYTLRSLNEFFGRALKLGKMPEDRDAIGREITSLVGDYRDSAILLGKRTAEMHKILASSNGIADFDPEAFTEADGRKLHAEMEKQADITFNLLRQKQSSLSGDAAEDAQRLLALETLVRERFLPLINTQITAERIRFHGDYHLGQVLYTGDDFMIIDFEGEPARPLRERREKALALRDVAGMVRSFQYAAYTALFGQVPGVSVQDSDRERVKAWGEVWNAAVSANYLSSYFNTAADGNFIPASQDERLRLLNAFLLHKALYEVAYELNNRPDWVQIPLRGILSIVQ